MMSDASPISRAWSLGQLEDDLTKGWDPFFDPQECHSDPIDFCSTRGAATASLEVHDPRIYAYIAFKRQSFMAGPLTAESCIRV